MNGIIEKYLFGKGIDVSREHTIKEAEHRYIEPGNLYLLRNETGVEVFDYLYSKGTINESKYFRILLYEWFIVVKKGGYICLEFEGNEILDCQALINEIALLNIYRERHRIVYEGSSGRVKTIIVQKTASCKRDDSELDKWTFGIVTNGKRKDFIKKSIDSIRALNIPEYEIILCGTYNGEVGADTKYIPFADKDDKGWITRKKNIVCENASHENIVIIHDRIYFDKDWFEGMKKWGNYFEVLSCPVMVTLKDGRKLISNWETLREGFNREDDLRLFHSNGHLDPSDWDKNAIIPGPFIALKKHIWAGEKWNENLFWGEAEDIELSHRQHRSGIMIRFNPYSRLHALSVSGVVYNSYYEKDIRKLGKFRTELPAPLVLGLKALDMLGFRRNQKIVQFAIREAKKFYNVSSWKEESKRP